MSKAYQEYEILFMVTEKKGGYLRFHVNGEGSRKVTFFSVDLQSIQVIQNSIRLPKTE